jgi:hypothetical protein
MSSVRVVMGSVAASPPVTIKMAHDVDKLKVAGANYVDRAQSC